MNIVPKNIINVLIVLSLILNETFCANILFLNGIPSPSHHLWNRNVMEAFAAKGHNITFLTPDYEKKPNANITYIQIENMYKDVYGGGGVDLSVMAEESALKSILTFQKFGNLICEIIVKSKGIDVIRNYPPGFKFDLVINDATGGPCLLFLLNQFNAPLVSITAFGKPDFTSSVIGGHVYDGYKPNTVLLYNMNMSFYQRIVNKFYNLFGDVLRKYYVLPKIDKFLRNKYPDLANMPYIGELEQRSSLFLVNSDTAIDYPEPTPPNVITIGGAQIQDPKPLPENMKNFIESSKKGTVLFSLGTNLKSAIVGKELLIKFLEAFRQMPDYNFLWKIDANDFDDNLPKNVMIQPWVPQTDVFAHPDIKAFMTHSGLLSTQEASWYGIPMITIPFFMDQYRNSFKCVQSGVAEEIDFRTMTTASARDTVLKVLGNPKYTEKIMLVSKRFRDQKEKPIDRAVWWLEWAVRNPDASHIKSPVLTMGSIQANNYDILLVEFLIVIFLTYYFTKCLTKRSLKTNSTKDKKNR